MKKSLKILIPLALIALAVLYFWPKLYGEIRDRRPVWSPDGRLIAFVSNRRLPGASRAFEKRGNNLWVIGSDGKGLKPMMSLKELYGRMFGAPRWSPDGKRILVESEDRFWIVSPDGEAPKALEKDMGDPQWSPDGKRILFTSLTEFRVENIWTVSADGNDPKPLTRMTRPNTDCSEPRWSPDGSRILYLSLRALDGSDTINGEEVMNIWVMNADGGNARALTRFEDPDAPPDHVGWLPGGMEILFHVPGKGEGSIPEIGNVWAMSADGSQRSPLSRNLPLLHCLRGLQSSPDGRKFLCESFDSPVRKGYGKETLWFFDRETPSQHPLTQDVKEEASRDARWSPDGREIVFSRYSNNFLDGANDRIWIMDADGKNGRALTGR